MSSNVRVSGSFREGKPYLRVAGTWKEGKEIHVRAGGTWRRVWQNIVYLTWTGGGSSNVQSFLSSKGLHGGKVHITLTGDIISGSTGTPALVTGNLAGFQEVTLKINPGVYVLGRGGNGGSGRNNVGRNNSGGSAGGRGGVAFQVTSPIRIDNHGTIGGGGGGGGGNMSASHQSCDKDGCSTGHYGIGGGGGGGAPYGRGSSSHGGTASKTGGGGGGSGTAEYGHTPRSGGRGGGIGANGYSSHWGGGAAGHAITGKSHIHFITTGTIIGPQS